MAKRQIFINSETEKDQVDKSIFAQISGDIFKRLSANDKSSIASWMASNYEKKTKSFPVPASVADLKPAQERRFYNANRGAALEKQLMAARKTIYGSGQEVTPAQMKGFRLLLNISKLMQAMAVRTKGGNNKMSRGELLAFQNRLNAMIEGSGVSQDYANLARMLGTPGGLKDPLAAGKNRRLY